MSKSATQEAVERLEGLLTLCRLRGVEGPVPVILNDRWNAEIELADLRLLLDAHKDVVAAARDYLVNTDPYRSGRNTMSLHNPAVMPMAKEPRLIRQAREWRWEGWK